MPPSGSQNGNPPQFSQRISMDGSTFAIASAAPFRIMELEWRPNTMSVPGASARMRRATSFTSSVAASGIGRPPIVAFDVSVNDWK